MDFSSVTENTFKIDFLLIFFILLYLYVWYFSCREEIQDQSDFLKIYFIDLELIYNVVLISIDSKIFFNT